MSRVRKKSRNTAAGPKQGQVWLGPAPPIAEPHTQALLAGILCGVFQELELSASLTDGTTWYALHTVMNVTTFEGAHGAMHPRWAYNGKSLERARQTGEVVLGRHAGFYDFFAPIAGGPWVLVAGPFARSRPRSAEILERWHGITGAQGSASDPEFLEYVQVSVDSTTFEGDAFPAFERMVRCLSALLGTNAPTRDVAREVGVLREALSNVRTVERMWQTVRAMLDERTADEYLGPAMSRALSLLGVSHFPKHMLVGLLPGLGKNDSPIDELLRRHDFQRRAAVYARQRSGMMVGRIGTQGVVLLRDSASSGARLRSELADAGDGLRKLARRSGLTLHVGLPSESAPQALPRRYESALTSAEFAVSTGRTWIRAEEIPEPELGAMGELRRRMAAAIREKPSLLAPRFGRFFEAVAAQAGQRLDLLRVHLEAAFDSVTDVFRDAGSLDERSLKELTSKLGRAAAGATTLEQLHAAYRAVIADVEAAVLRPQLARSDQRVRRAMVFAREHSAERLSVAKAARVAGLAPRYFSKLFAENQRVTFHQYLLSLRVERAKQMLLSSRLSVERVGKLTGFPSRTHFHRAFKRALGVSPQDYRVHKLGAGEVPRTAR
jgi:AraC-like DNA-binding protein